MPIMILLRIKESRRMWTIIVISTIFHVVYSASRKGTVTEYYINRKIKCAGKRTYTTTSEIQCVHRCLRSVKCEILNYREREGGNSMQDKNCEVFDVPSNHESCSSTKDIGWKGLFLKIKVEPKPKEPITSPAPIAPPAPITPPVPVVYKSCKEIKQNQPGASSGVYDLQDGRHFCRMGDIPECGSGGWTLALKMDGARDTFSAEKDLWVNTMTYNVDNGLKSFYHEEAKFNAFSKLSFDSVCIGMTHSGITKWILINQSGSSLQYIFSNGGHIWIIFTRDKWKSLINGASLQLHCNRQGFNVRDDHGRIITRIGLVGNNENNCDGPDSFIGIGTVRSVPCFLSNFIGAVSCGNFASCYPDNGDKALAAMGYILVQ